MDLPADSVRDYYDRNAETEFSRLSGRSIEFEVTRRFLDEFLPKGGNILDVGAGPGRYSIYPARCGHSVTLLDVSPECVRLAVEESVRSGVRLQNAVVGDARDLVRFEANTFDAVLCLGPLYHLHQAKDRNRAIDECLRVLKDGGIAFFGFISKYAPISDLAKSEPQKLLERKAILHRFIDTGIHESHASHAGWTDAYFVDPLEVGRLMEPFPITELAVAGAEGMVAQSESRICEQGEAVFAAWADFSYETARERSILASSEHILFVGRKDPVTAE